MENIFEIKTIKVRDDFVRIEKNAIRDVRESGYTKNFEETIDKRIAAYFCGIEKSRDRGLVMTCSDEKGHVKEYAFRSMTPPNQETRIKEFIELGTVTSARALSYLKDDDEGYHI